MFIRNGCSRDLIDKRDKEYKIKKPLKSLFLSILPRKIDNSEIIPSPIRDQGEEGSCVGFATTKAMELAEWINKRIKNDLSERFCYEVGKQNDEWEGNNYEGTSIRGALKGLRKLGICEEIYLPYKAKQKVDLKNIPPKIFHNAKEHLIIEYNSLFGYKGKVDLWKVKRAISSKGFAVCGFYLPASFISTKHIYRDKEDSSLIDYDSGHAMLVVGYDDETKLFTIVNSWGIEFGDKGICYFDYKLFEKSCFSAWTFSIY